MNIRYAAIFASLSLALLASEPAWASDDATLPPATTDMTQEEYAAYRARIREQLKAAQQEENKSEAETTTTRRKSSNGYGQGYRARQERAGGGMGHAGGRGR